MHKSKKNKGEKGRKKPLGVSHSREWSIQIADYEHSATAWY